MEQDTKLWHRKQCSGRILIGPWEFKAPQQQTPWTTSPEQLDQSSIDESTRTIKR
jgi:hypothetical protein